MIEILPRSHDNIIGVKAIGKVTASDYENILIPRLDDLLATHEKMRFLYYVGSEFEGFEAGAAWDDAKYYEGHRDSFDKIAVVTDAKWLEWASKFGGIFVHGEIKTFHTDQLDEAWEWLEA